MDLVENAAICERVLRVHVHVHDAFNVLPRTHIYIDKGR